MLSKLKYHLKSINWEITANR